MNSPAPSQPAVAPPATLVVFGATGDLTRRLLIPSLLNLTRDELLDTGFRILGVSFEESDDQGLRTRLAEFAGSPEAGNTASDGAWAEFSGRIEYLRGDFEEAATYEEIANRVTGNAAFYLATAPSFFGPIVDHLADAGLLDEATGFRRVVVEKPFGHDLASAQALNARILARIPEAQIYRIDHFLGKETVRNIMVSRFANGLLEAIWNNRYIDHVQITAAETVTVGKRGKFYDATGALRDMVPNHLFQLLAMVAMEPPNSFDAEAVRDEKARVLKAVRGSRPEEVHNQVVRGRYQAAADGSGADYLTELDVAPESRTETFAAMRLTIDTWRWAGVPFYLRTGKALAARNTEIVLQLKPVPFALFSDTDVERLPPNRIVLQVQPNEGMRIDFLFKVPGPAVDLFPSSLDFQYADHFPPVARTGYETLLYDVFIGDQTLFQRADMIEAGWTAVQPIIDAWSHSGEPDAYRSGSTGPTSADALLQRDGRSWHVVGEGTT